MPDFFREWLLGLNEEQADELDQYLDNGPDIREEVVQVLLTQHPNLLDF